MSKKYYYKEMDKDMKCGSFQFKMRETYTIENKELELYSDNVFHFCEKLEDTLSYYSNSTDRHFLIEVLEGIESDGDRLFSNKIRIVREITRDEIEEHIQDKETFNAKRFFAYYSCNIKTLERFTQDSLWEIRNIIANNLNTPSHILELLAKDEDWIVRRSLAEHPNTPIHILEELSKDKELWVRCSVANNVNVPIYILEKLSKEKNWEVHSAVARNLNSPIYLLEKLAKDEVWTVRITVAENLNTPVYLLKELAKDENWAVRLAVVKNPNTSAYILEDLVKDKEFCIRPIAKKRLKEITQ